MRFEEVPSEMMKWTKYHNPKTGALESLPGLVIRRRSETSMWRALEKHADEISDEDMRQPAVAPTPIRSVMQSKEATTSVATSVAGVLLVASEMKKQIEDAQGLIEAFKKAAHDPNFVIASMVVLAGIAIFYWRSKRMNEEETM
jgi:hypothetical protein